MPRNPKHFFYLLLVLYLAGGLSVSAFGQGEKLPKPPKTKVIMPRPGEEPPGIFYGEGITSERSMLVDPSVAIKLCVAQGELKINGWARNEVRVFVKDGRKFRLQAREKSPESGKVNWLWIGNVVEGRPGPAAECLAGERIEIDAPVGSNFDLFANDARTSIDSVKRVKVKTNAGVVSLRNVTGGINAWVGQGDIMIEDSAGAIDVESTEGNIIAVEVGRGQIGELFRARTNSGTISLQKVEHRQIQASSISGSLLFDGKFLTGGIYSFRTSAGDIKLAIPAASSCTFTTTYAEGAFHSELPLKVLTENVTPRAKIVVSRIGAGDSTVNITTSTGRIGIRRQS